MGPTMTAILNSLDRPDILDQPETADPPEDPHRRADELLAEAATCSDPCRRAALRQEAVMLTLDVADRVARRYLGRGIDYDDLVQVGRMALVKAAAAYRPERGSGFVPYALPTVSGEVKRHFRDCAWLVRPPRRLQEARALLTSQEETLRQELHREPTPRELADATGLERDEVFAARLCGMAYSGLSLDLPLDSPDGHLEVPARESDDVERLVTLRALSAALTRLTDRERRIVQLRFVEERTQSEIGEAIGVSQMQVSRLLTGIIAKLRRDLDEVTTAA
jgi:RNA polymerase sigma-B factor